MGLLLADSAQCHEGIYATLEIERLLLLYSLHTCTPVLASQLAVSPSGLMVLYTKNLTASKTIFFSLIQLIQQVILYMAFKFNTLDIN